MKFARYTFLLAAVYGILVIFPLYFSEQKFAFEFPPPLNHPEYFYSFIGVTLVWQFLFLAIAVNPVKYKAMMILSFFEKMSLVPTFIILFPRGQFPQYWIPLLIIDIGFGIFFLIAFFRSKEFAAFPSQN